MREREPGQPIETPENSESYDTSDSATFSESSDSSESEKLVQTEREYAKAIANLVKLSEIEGGDSKDQIDSLRQNFEHMLNQNCQLIEEIRLLKQKSQRKKIEAKIIKNSNRQKEEKLERLERKLVKKKARASFFKRRSEQLKNENYSYKSLVRQMEHKDNSLDPAYQELVFSDTCEGDLSCSSVTVVGSPLSFYEDGYLTSDIDIIVGDVEQMYLTDISESPSASDDERNAPYMEEDLRVGATNQRNDKAKSMVWKLICAVLLGTFFIYAFLQKTSCLVALSVMKKFFPRAYTSTLFLFFCITCSMCFGGYRVYHRTKDDKEVLAQVEQPYYLVN